MQFKADVFAKGNIGISGCKLRFMGETATKISSSKEFNKRLLLQAEKQDQFTKSFNIKNIYAPKIHSVHKKHLHSFTMDIINGLSWQEFFSFAGVQDIKKFTDLILEYLTRLKAQSSLYDVNIVNHSIITKLDSLVERSRNKDIIYKLIKYMDKNKETIPRSFFHGDLTLSNILFKGDAIYLIDFLDCCVSSYFIDIIKLRQDLVFHWCLKYNKIFDLRFKSIFKTINDAIEKEFEREFNNVFHVLEMLNILRIEPYLPKTKLYITDRMLLEKQVSLS